MLSRKGIIITDNLFEKSIWCSFIRGNECPIIDEKSFQVELSKVKETVHQVKCVTSTSEERFIVITNDEGNPLPDSRYITIRQHEHPLIISEIQVYGGKCR